MLRMDIQVGYALNAEGSLTGHRINDKELHNLIEARRLFHEGMKKKDCSYCKRGWELVDIAIKEKYLKLSGEVKSTLKHP